MKEEYDLSGMKSRKNPYAGKLEKEKYPKWAYWNYRIIQQTTQDYP
ncbi:MAG: hypothetical protein JW874_02115 [Spirochaetales bacterium]|nr:hypothetical protein [Spirochaetales bacterium]